MSPYELRILLDVYVGSPITVSKNAPIYDSTITGLQERGFIEPLEDDAIRHEDQEFLPTEKLKVLMHYITTAPDPVWRMP